MPGVLSRQINPVWQILAVVGVLAVGVAVLAWPQSDPKDTSKQEPEKAAPVPETPAPPAPKSDSIPVKIHTPTPVAAYRTAEVPAGFRGDLHPMLHGRTFLDVTANWTPLERSQLKLEAPESVQAWYTRLRPAIPHATYTAREFSAFLPENVTEVGQVWALDPDKIQRLLGQFHPGASMHLVATGRRAGPDGAFAVLRAMSPTHFEITFRIHAEFFITPRTGGQMQSVYAWFTPAYFAGRVLVNKTTGTVEYFKLALPTEKALNAFLTMNPSLLGVAVLGHDIVRVERMELVGGDERHADSIPWAKALTPTETHRRLARIFYAFEQIDWVPPAEAQKLAQSKNRPIFAIVSWGSTDDQSC